MNALSFRAEWRDLAPNEAEKPELADIDKKIRSFDALRSLRDDTLS
jgi:hypothetical protein